MKPFTLTFLLFCASTSFASPKFIYSSPGIIGKIDINAQAFCKTAKSTLDYLNKGSSYDPQVIHPGRTLPISLNRIKATLHFMCEHQKELANPRFIEDHFDFIRWEPDSKQARLYSKSKPLLKNLPPNKILMTKYYVHSAVGSESATKEYPYAIYALPEDEKNLSLEAASTHQELTRFQYGKQAILKGALKGTHAKSLVYLKREDLEAALLQGTIVVKIHGKGKILNVHRNNNISYDRQKSPYEQERYWYFKEVESIKGYGKDAEYKINIDPKVTFAADLNQFGLGKVLMVQYRDKNHQDKSVMGIFADTGGAFEKNLYQVDFLSGKYPSKEACYSAWKATPDYVNAYFLVLKNKFG